MKIPTQKGEHSCKCTDLSLKQKEGINEVRMRLGQFPIQPLLSYGTPGIYSHYAASHIL